MMNSNPDSPMSRRATTTDASAITRGIAAIWPGEWWPVLNLYLLVVLLLVVAGSALEM